MHGATGEAAPSRRLRGVEHATFLASRSSPLNLVLLVGLDGPSLETVLPAVLARVQARHPLLRARILGADGHPSFSVAAEPSGVAPIPMRVVTDPSPDVRGLVEEEMNTGFDVTSPPLARAVYVCGTGSPAWLIVTLLHCICDGVSAGALLEEVLEGCRLGLEGAPSRDVPGTYGPPAPLTDLLPPTERGARGATRRVAFATREIAEELRYRRHSKGAGRTLPAHSRARTRMLSLGRDETEQLITWCRGKRLTLTSVLNAALLLEADRRLCDGQPAAMRALVWVDLRPQLSPPPEPATLACYISMLRFVLQVDPSEGLARLAQRVQDRTVAGVRRGDRFSAAILSPSATRAMDRTRSMRLGTTALSYGGADPVRAAYGAIEVREVRAFVPDNPRGAPLALVAGLRNGAIWCNLLYLDAEIDEATAEAVGTGLLEVLTSGTRP